MPLLVIVLLGAVVLWLLLSVLFEKIGNIAVNVYKKFKNELIDDGEERKNE
jgi:hypothetical protein